MRLPQPRTPTCVGIWSDPYAVLGGVYFYIYSDIYKNKNMHMHTLRTIYRNEIKKN